MDKSNFLNDNQEFINYMSPIFNGGRMDTFLIEAESIHKRSLKDKGLQPIKCTLTHIEVITDKDIIFSGIDSYEDTISIMIPIEQFK